MRLIDYFDRGADLYPGARLPARRHAGWTYSGRARARRIASPTACWRPAWGAARRPRSTAPTMRRPTPACWASCAPASPGRRSMRAMRSRRISTSSTTPTWSSCSIIRASRPTLPRIREACPKIRDFVCLDAPSFDAWLSRHKARRRPTCADDPDDVAFLASSGGTTGRPKGVQITNRNIETMNSIFWACMPVDGAAGPSDGGADDPCGGRLLLPAAALWRHQHLHGHGRSRRHPGRDREASRDAHLHAADARSTCCWPIPTSASTTTAR